MEQSKIRSGVNIKPASAKRRGALAAAIRRPLRLLRYGSITLLNLAGTHPKHCPICGHDGKFYAYGHPPRYDAECPKCLSLERHRLLTLLLQDRPDLASGRIVHFAPEPTVKDLLRTMSSHYQTADLMMSDCDLQLNIESIDLPDASVDTFVASHILEHVDDRKALSELHRCLAPGGSALIMVPIIEGWETSYENPAVTTDSERLLHFGQADHVRYFGRDLRNRIRDAGFGLSLFTASGEDAVKYGLIKGETVFIATKP